MNIQSTQNRFQPPAPKPATPEPDKIPPLDVVAIGALDTGTGWTGINKPIRVTDPKDPNSAYVAKNNTDGAFISLHPHHDTRKDNITEIVMSHIVADEFKMPSLTFREGNLVTPDGRKSQVVLSPLRTDFKTLEHVAVEEIKDGDQAVALTVLQGGLLGDWDSTFNDSNLWVRNDGVAMGADYGYAGKPGISCLGVPFANIKIMKAFANRENVTSISDRIKNLSDEEIQAMVERQGSKWIRDWNPQISKELSDNLISNRNRMRQHNPFLKYVEGFHPGLKGPLLHSKYPAFFWKCSQAEAPPLNRPDQWLDVLIAVSKYKKSETMAKFFTYMRSQVQSPEEKAAEAKKG
ncbi:hypothetical protein JST97_17855 [bacterium]|nr:hypothetical protein [bacterium]